MTAFMGTFLAGLVVRFPGTLPPGVLKQIKTGVMTFLIAVLCFLMPDIPTNMIRSGGPALLPTVLTKQPRAQKWSPQ